MKYDNIKEGRFVARINRFVATVNIGGKEELCHVKNTGRCKELLLPGAVVFLQESSKATRKTRYDLISVYKGRRLINIDSQAPNKVAAEYLPGVIPGIRLLKAEAKYHKSRLDFYLETAEDKIFVEVKGVTLEEAGVAKFPDAPTERGVRHLQELGRSIQEGYKAAVFFVIQMKGVKYFTPNYQTHRAFGQALQQAQEQGVSVLAIDCHVTESQLIAGDPVRIALKEEGDFE